MEKKEQEKKEQEKQEAKGKQKKPSASSRSGSSESAPAQGEQQGRMETLQGIQLPYGPAQQAILARKTKTIDIKVENKLREQVLNLSLELDQHDTEVYRF